MGLDAAEIDLNDVRVLETLKKSEYSVVFKVLVHETTCVLKVYHNKRYERKRPGGPEAKIYISESTAYRHLKAKGLCEQRVIPDFYGTVTDIYPSHWPYLRMFNDEEAPLTAILIEHVPDMHEIDLSNFSPQNVQKLREILREIHRAGVSHGDTYPRNMMVSRDPTTDQARVLWIDFDRAETFPERPSKRPSKKQKRICEEEMGLVDEFIWELTQDNEQGELYHAYSWYIDYLGPLGWAEDYEWVKEEIAARKYNPFKHEGAKLQKWLDRRKDDGMEWNGEDWVLSNNMRWNGQVYVEIEDRADRSPN